MSNHITIELCEADRARLDSLIAYLIDLIDHLPRHIDVSAPQKLTITKLKKGDPGYCEHQKAEEDPLQKKLAEVVANAKEAKPVKKGAETPQDATEAETLTETPPTEEKPTTASPEPAVEPVTAVTLQLKVIELIRAKKKPQVLEVLNSVGVQTVSAVPEDKVAEVYAKLTTLEG